jgi:hypothetical protein
MKAKKKKMGRKMNEVNPWHGCSDVCEKIRNAGQLHSLKSSLDRGHARPWLWFGETQGADVVRRKSASSKLIYSCI